MALQESVADLRSESPEWTVSVVAVLVVVWGWLGAWLSVGRPIIPGAWWVSPALAYGVAAGQSLVAVAVFCVGPAYAYHRAGGGELGALREPSRADLARLAGLASLLALVALSTLPRMLGVPLSGTVPVAFDGLPSVGSTAVPAAVSPGLDVRNGVLPYAVRAVVSGPAYGLLFYGVATAVAGPAHGLLFHVVLQGTLERTYSPRRAVVATAVTVAVLAGLPTGGVPGAGLVFAVAWFAGYTFHRTGNLAVPMVAYGAFNLVFLAVYALAFHAHLTATT